MEKLLNTVYNALIFTKYLNKTIRFLSNKRSAPHKKPLIIFDHFNEYINQLEHASADELQNAHNLIHYLM